MSSEYKKANSVGSFEFEVEGLELTSEQVDSIKVEAKKAYSKEPILTAVGGIILRGKASFPQAYGKLKQDLQSLNNAQDRFSDKADIQAEMARLQGVKQTAINTLKRALSIYTSLMTPNERETLEETGFVQDLESVAGFDQKVAEHANRDNEFTAIAFLEGTFDEICQQSEALKKVVMAVVRPSFIHAIASSRDLYEVMIEQAVENIDTANQKMQILQDTLDSVVVDTGASFCRCC